VNADFTHFISHKLLQKVEAGLEMALIHTEFCRDWRNRHIAHRDLELALGRGVSPLESASEQKVSKALKSLAEVLNTVAAHYLETTTFFESWGSTVGGAGNLLCIVHEGIKAVEGVRSALELELPYLGIGKRGICKMCIRTPPAMKRWVSPILSRPVNACKSVRRVSLPSIVRPRLVGYKWQS
jgi:hypothetical protein